MIIILNINYTLNKILLNKTIIKIEKLLSKKFKCDNYFYYSIFEISLKLIL